MAPTRRDDPLVLVSLSTFAFAGMAPALQRIVDACARLDARIVVTTGAALDPTDLHAPASVEVHRFVPHVEVMPHATLLIGHGGHGTTMQALAHDLPVVVMPMDSRADQAMVGRSLEHAGAGRVVAKKATTPQLAPVIASMLSDGPHRTAAARLGATIRARPGATRSADLLVEMLTGARPGVHRPGCPPPRPRRTLRPRT